MNSAGKDTIPDSIREQAAQWLARHEGAEPGKSDPAFTAWLARDLRHRLAYAEAERTWRESLVLAGWSAALLDWYKAQGCFTEIIRFQTRLFVPLETALEVISAITRG